MKTQKSILEKMLRGTGTGITHKQAKTLGINNLRARLHEMKQDGLIIRTVHESTGENMYYISRADVNNSRKIRYKDSSESVDKS